MEAEKIFGLSNGLEMEFPLAPLGRLSFSQTGDYSLWQAATP